MTGRTQIAERKSLLVVAVAALTFVCVQQAGGWLLRVSWPTVRFPGLAEARQQAQRAAEEPVVAFLGSSRFGCGVKIEWLRSSWENLGLAHWGSPERFAVPAGDFLAVEYLYKQLHKDGLRPSAVVLEISPETIADRTFWLYFHVIRQLGWQPNAALYQEMWDSRLLRRHLMGQAVPLWMFRQAIRHELTRFLLPELPPRSPSVLEGDVDRASDQARLHAASLNKPLEERIESGVRPLRNWLMREEYRVGGANWAALARLIVQFETEGVRVVLARVPVTAAHRQLYSGVVEERFQAALSDLRRGHPRLIIVEPPELADELFEDNHHLTATGGILFSQHLAAELQRTLTAASLAGR